MSSALMCEAGTAPAKPLAIARKATPPTLEFHAAVWDQEQSAPVQSTGEPPSLANANANANAKNRQGRAQRISKRQIPSGPLTLAGSIDAMLSSTDPKEELKKLAVALTDSPGRSLPLPALVRMVDGYRASRAWRGRVSISVFIKAMFEVNGGRKIRDEQFKELLRVWSWRYGEASTRQGKPAVVDNDLLPHVLPFAVEEGLENGLMTDSQLRLLIGAIGTEPDAIVPGDMGDKTLQDHAWQVASGLNQVLISGNPTRICKQTVGRAKMDLLHVRRCINYFLQQPAIDPRWKPAVLSELSKHGPTSAMVGPLIAPPQWTQILLEECQAYLAKTHPDHPTAQSMDDVIKTLAGSTRQHTGPQSQSAPHHEG